MQQISSRPRLALLSHDLTTIRIIADAVSRHFEPVWARDADGLMSMVRHDPPPRAVMLDNSLPQINAVELLQLVKDSRPAVRRILVTEHCDLSIIVRGLHTGAVERIVYKPIYVPEALAALDVSQLTQSMRTPAPAAAHPPAAAAFGAHRTRVSV